MDAIIRPSADLRNYYNEMKSELELLRNLAEAEEDEREGRVAPIQGTFDDIRTSFMKREYKNLI